MTGLTMDRRAASGAIVMLAVIAHLFKGGRGGHELDPKVTDVRIMDPVLGGKHPLPSGYVSYGNASGQTVHPWTGRTIDPANPWWHWEWSSR